MEGIIRTAAEQGAVPAGSVRGCLSGLATLQTLLADKVGSDLAPDLQPMREMLSALAQTCDSVLGVAQLQDGDVVTGEASAAAAASGDIRSREDARRALERVCQFIERSEPSNPAPLFIRRAQQLMTKTFVEIIEDLAPDSLGQIQKMTGLDRQ